MIDPTPPDWLPVNVALFELVMKEPPEVPVPPRKEMRSPGKELLFVLVTVMVGFVFEPVIPIPLKVSVLLLKLKLKIDALFEKLKLETENEEEFSVGLVAIPKIELLKIAWSLTPGIVLGFQLAGSFMSLFGL